MNFLVRYWKGNLPLVQAFWTYFIGLTCLLTLLASQIGMFVEGEALLPGLILVATFWTFTSIVFIWQTVGVVRAAARYATIEGRKHYSMFVYAIVFAACAIHVIIIWNVTVPEVLDIANITRGDPQWANPIITVLPNGREIEFLGIIKARSASELEKVIRNDPKASVLHLDTPGGREIEAQAMANIVRRYNLSTYVDQTCSSAGILVFLAGREHVIRSDARLGFHSSRSPGMPDSKANDRQIKILMDAGASTSFVERVINTPPESIWYPASTELLNQGLITKISDGADFSVGTREKAKYSLEGLKEALQTDPEMRALAERVPLEYGIVLVRAAAAISDGVSVIAATHDLRVLLQTTVANAYACASGAALDAWLDLNIEMFRRNMYEDPENTLLVFGLKAPKGSLPDYPKEADQKYIVELLNSPSIPAIPVNVAQERAAVYEIVEHLGEARDAQKLLASIPGDRLSQIAACEMWNSLLLATKNLPSERRHSLIRYILFVGNRAKL